MVEVKGVSSRKDGKTNMNGIYFPENGDPKKDAVKFAVVFTKDDMAESMAISSESETGDHDRLLTTDLEEILNECQVKLQKVKDQILK